MLVLDWDVHHGNGTNAIFHDSREVLFVSIHQFPFWPGTGPLDDVGEGEGEGYSINLPVPGGTGEAAFLSLIEHIVMPVGRQYRPDLILISAGYDAHRDDPLGGLMLDTSSFASMSNRMRALGEELGAPVGAVLEGGYDLSALADSVAETMAALDRGPLQPEVARHPLADDAAERARPLLGPLNELRVGARIAIRELSGLPLGALGRRELAREDDPEPGAEVVRIRADQAGLEPAGPGLLRHVQRRRAVARRSRARPCER